MEESDVSLKADYEVDADIDKLLEESYTKPKSTESPVPSSTKKEKGSFKKKGAGVDIELEELLQEIADIPAKPKTKDIPLDPELEELLRNIDAPPQSKVSTEKAGQTKKEPSDLEVEEFLRGLDDPPKSEVSSQSKPSQNEDTDPAKTQKKLSDQEVEDFMRLFNKASTESSQLKSSQKEEAKSPSDIKLEDVQELDVPKVSSEKSPPTKQKEEKRREDPDGKLQHYYDTIVEKVGAEVAEIVVWEGAAKNKKIKSSLNDLVDEESYLDEDDSARVAKLFSSQLTSEKKIRERFLPTMKTIATCEWDSFGAGIAVYLLVMLLHKMPKKGLSLVINTLPKEAYYRVIGDAVSKECEAITWPKFMVKMPKPDKFLSPEEFKELLVQNPKNLGSEWIGNDSKINWIFLLGYSPECIHGEIVPELKDMPWSDILVALSSLFENKGYYHQDMVARAGVRVVKTWGDATTLENRKAALKQMKDDLDYKEFEKILEQIISTATFPLEDLKGSKDEPCLLVTSPTTQLAVKLFQHTMQTVGINEETVRSLVKQKIGDRTLAAILRVMARMQLLDDELADDVVYDCSSEGLLESCAELLRVAPNPRTHPIMEILEERDEKTCYKALELLTPDLYAPNCNPDDGNALHIAGTYGYTSVCKEILARGFHRLLEKSGRPPIDINGSTAKLRPASMAAQTRNFATAKELLQVMDPEDAKQLFKTTTDIKPEIDLHEVMDEVSKKRGARWDPKARDEGEWKGIPRHLEKKEIQERVDFLNTALDTALESRHVDLTVLIQDAHGQISEQFTSGQEKEPDLEEGKKKAGKTLYRKIANSECEELKSHECFATLTNIVWIDYGIVQGVLFSLYLIFMTFLTTALVLAARSGDPSQYDDPLDWFRLFCEVVTLLWILFDLTLEIYQLGQVVYRSLKQHSLCVRREPQTGNNSSSENTSDGDKGADDNDGSDEEDNDDEEDDESIPNPEEPKTNPFLAATKDIFSDYFLDWQNILDDLAILCVLLIIPFRISDSDTQWVFAALAFMFHGLRIFKYAIMFKSVGEYVAILVLLIKRDVPQFVTVFLVIIFSLGGALYLALIGHYNNSNIDTENNNDTSEVYLLWWTGIRILAEGSALTYYGPGGFSWLGILIYWLFLFIVVVVLLNILIAQFSKSYEEELERAQINVILTRTEIILKMEQSILIRPCVRFVRRMRAKLTKSSLEYQRVERLSFAGEREEDKPASSEQVEELQTQTTNLGLQLRKQMDDNIGKSTLKVEEMRAEIGPIVRELRVALQVMKTEVEGKLVGLERAVIDTRRYVDEIKELLISLKEKK